MLIAEPIINLNGFGNGKAPGEYYYSQNFRPTQFGTAPALSVKADGTNDGLQGLAHWFAQAGSTVYSLDSAKIYSSSAGSSSWTSFKTVTAGNANGLIGDQKGRLLYASNQYLNMWDGSFHDSWKDFGSTITVYRPLETYEDLLLAGNGDKIAILDTSDGWNTAGFTLPSGFVVRAIKSGRTGVGIAANFGSRGVFFLWDAFSDRSITPWIWFNAPIQSLASHNGEWIVITSHEIVATNGYSTTSLPPLPDAKFDDNALILAPQGSCVVDNSLLLANTSYAYNRKRSGFWMLNLSTGLWTYATEANLTTTQITPGAVFQDTGARLRVSYQVAPPSGSAIKYLGALTTSVPTRASLILGPFGQGENKKVAEGLALSIGTDMTDTNSFPVTFDIAVKVSNMKRQPWSYQLTSEASTELDEVVVTGNIGFRSDAEVGDEITIMDGDNAGAVRHVVAIANAGTATETWTLDAALTHLTAASTSIQVAPFKLVKKMSVTSAAQLGHMYFNILNKLAGQHYLVKIIIDNMTFAVAPEIRGGTFYYSDLGVI